MSDTTYPAELDASGPVLDDSEVSGVVAQQAQTEAMIDALVERGYTVIPPAEKNWYSTSASPQLVSSKGFPTFVRMLAAYAARASMNRASGGPVESGGLTDKEVASLAGITTHTATARGAELNSLGLVEYVLDESGRKYRRQKYAARQITDIGLAALHNLIGDDPQIPAPAPAQDPRDEA